MNAPDHLRLNAYRRALGFAMCQMAELATRANAVEITDTDFQWIWKELAEVGETPVHIEQHYPIRKARCTMFTPKQREWVNRVYPMRDGVAL